MDIFQACALRLLKSIHSLTEEQAQFVLDYIDMTWIAAAGMGYPRAGYTFDLTLPAR